MNKSKKYINKNKSSQFYRVVYFPNQINAIAIMLIVLIYGFILFGLGKITFPKYDYISKLDYQQGGYHTEINPYVFIRGVVTDRSEVENKQDLRVQYRVFSYINAIGTNKPTNVRYAYSGIDVQGNMHYFYETSRKGTTLPVSHYVAASAIYVSGDRFDRYFMKVKYNITSGDTVLDKEVEISEKVIKLTNNELFFDKFTKKFKTSNELDEKLKVIFTAKQSTSATDQYDTNVKIEINDRTVPYYINMQSWIVTESKDIYPFLGLYNFCSPINFNPWYNTTVYKYIEPAYIYMKLYYTDQENEISSLYYKVSFTELLNNN